MQSIKVNKKLEKRRRKKLNNQIYHLGNRNVKLQTFEPSSLNAQQNRLNLIFSSSNVQTLNQFQLSFPHSSSTPKMVDRPSDCDRNTKNKNSRLHQTITTTRPRNEVQVDLDIQILYLFMSVPPPHHHLRSAFPISPPSSFVFPHPPLSTPRLRSHCTTAVVFV